MADPQRREGQRPEKKGWLEEKVEKWINNKSDDFVHRNDPPKTPPQNVPPKRKPPARPM